MINVLYSVERGSELEYKKMSFLRRQSTFINAIEKRLQMPWENGFEAGTSLAIEAFLFNYLPLTGQLLVSARSTFITLACMDEQ